MLEKQNYIIIFLFVTGFFFMLQYKVFAFMPNDGDGIYYYSLGEEYYSDGNYDKAIKAFDQALYFFDMGKSKGDVSIARIYYAEGDCYYYKGQYELAIINYDKSNEKLIGMSANIEDYDNIINKNPSANAYYARGFLYFQSGKYEKALNNYNNSLRIEPGNARVYLSKAIIYEKLGLKADAINAYRNFISESGQPDTLVDAVKQRIETLNQ